MQAGRVLVLTGDGKGKTTAALGLALRASGHGMRVCIIQFIKKRSDVGEVLALGALGPGVEILPMGTGFVRRDRLTEKDIAAAAKALELAWEKMRACDVLVLDEVNNAIDAGLIRVEDVLSVVEHRPPDVHLVLTGRNAHPRLVEAADTVTEMRNVKHPGDGGGPAVKGIEY